MDLDLHHHQMRILGEKQGIDWSIAPSDPLYLTNKNHVLHRF
jgi:hypothetical protein